MEPVMVTWVPPAEVPLFGDIDSMEGAAALTGCAGSIENTTAKIRIMEISRFNKFMENGRFKVLNKFVKIENLFIGSPRNFLKVPPDCLLS
ncbi:hypothetical protein [Thermoanaerobacterium sp. DL9XJH110]|uniref:hypothetical protein n=1 Tax=Thermoanaerobacterium sp. DL9XJH110 TaxID=3386643 RepID=UPI003BB56803